MTFGDSPTDRILLVPCFLPVCMICAGLNNHGPAYVQISVTEQIEKPRLKRERLFREQTCRQLNFLAPITQWIEIAQSLGILLLVSTTRHLTHETLDHLLSVVNDGTNKIRFSVPDQESIFTQTLPKHSQVAQRTCDCIRSSAGGHKFFTRF